MKKKIAYVILGAFCIALLAIIVMDKIKHPLIAVGEKVPFEQSIFYKGIYGDFCDWLLFYAFVYAMFLVAAIFSWSVDTITDKIQ